MCVMIMVFVNCIWSSYYVKYDMKGELVVEVKDE